MKKIQRPMGKDNTFYSCSFCFVNFCLFQVNWFPGKFFFNSVFVIENINLHTNSTKKEYLVANRQLYWVSLQQSYEHWEFLRQKNQFFKAVQERIYSLAWNFCSVFFYVQSKRIRFCGLIIDIFQVEFSISSSNRCH